MAENNKISAAQTEAGQKVPKRILASLLSSVSAGVVPRAGAPYIAIGRADEINALLSDLEMINDGGGSMRFLIGRYGSGKSFLMQLIRGYALERGFITADADLSPERKLCGKGGSGVATYRELMKNIASKASPDGGALPKMLARWLDALRENGAGTDNIPDSVHESTDGAPLVKKMAAELRGLEYLVGGFDFASVVAEYYRACENDDDDKRSACLRWLRGEYANRTEARRALGIQVSLIIDDNNWYDFIKLWAALCKKMGYRGFVVFIDECVNLYKITNRVSRENNYEKILSMFNDTLQGRAPGLAIVLGGTPQFLEDQRRGLFSYEALRSRLCDSRFAVGDYKNLMGPVIRLRRLSDDELLALIRRVTVLYSQYYGVVPKIGDAEMTEFFKICTERAGASEKITPREMLRDYMTVLNILMQNPDADFADIVKSESSESSESSAGGEGGEGGESAAGAGSNGDGGALGGEAGAKITIDDLGF